MDKEPIGLLKQEVVKSSGDYVGLLERIHNRTSSQSDRVEYESMDRHQRVLLGVGATAPELFSGRLPERQMSGYEFPDGYDYVLAVNRNGVENYDELSKFIGNNHGINTNRYNKSEAFSDRFYIPGRMNKSGENIAYNVSKVGMLETLSEGYGSGFNFITCVPFKAIKDSERSLLNDMAELDYDGQSVVENLIKSEMTPKDLLIMVDGKMLVSEKYIAGVVDNDGVYVPNQSFLGKKTVE